MNPARVFGPAVIYGDYNYHWLWWVSEILGAIFSVVIEALIFAPVVVKGDESNSPLWWWRLFLWYNGMGRGSGRRKEYLSWADAVRSGDHHTKKRHSIASSLGSHRSPRKY